MIIQRFQTAFLAMLTVIVMMAVFVTTSYADDTSSTPTGTAVTKQAEVKIKPGQLLVRPRSATPEFSEDPYGWIAQKQRQFTGNMQKALQGIRSDSPFTAAWTLILLSFGYGIFHAAGPGHGKAVISAWLLASERELKRGVIISFMAALIQAATAIIIVSSLMLLVTATGSMARVISKHLETISYLLIAFLGVFLIVRGIRHFRARSHSDHIVDTKENTKSADHHNHNDHLHEHHHGESCCGHDHAPDPDKLSGEWSWKKAFSIAFAVGIRPCSGAIVVLLASAALGIYWAGIISTLAMGIGVAITVSAIAVLSVKSRDFILKTTSYNTAVLQRVSISLQLIAGLCITTIGAMLFWASMNF